MKILKLGMAYIKKYKLYLITYISILLLNNFFNMVLPYIRGDMIDKLLMISNLLDIYIYIYIILSIVLIQTINNYFVKMIYTKIQINSGYNLNIDILNHIKRLPISYFYDKDGSYLNQKINNDANQIVIFSINIIADFIINALLLLISMYFMFRISSIIIYLILCLVFCYLILYKVMKKQIYEKQYIMKEQQSVFFSDLFKQITNIKFFKMHSSYHVFDGKLCQSKDNLYKAAIKNQKIDYMYSNIKNVLTIIAMTSVMVIGANEVIVGNLSIGIFTVLTSYFSIFISSVNYFIELGSVYQSTLVSYNRIYEILSIPQLKDGDIIIEDIDTVELKNINFSYTDKPFINNLNIKFKKGNLYSIVGENATGKSTIVDILLGIHLNDIKGSILFNSVDIKDINMEVAIRDNIAVVEQQPFIIEDYTIFENLKVFSHELDNKNIHKFLSLFKINNGLSKTKFSGGETQKIAIIRELLKDNQLIIFDEPTSCLDVNSKSILIEYLKQIKKDKIIIVITHDNELINSVDEIIDISKLMQTENVGQELAR